METNYIKTGKKILTFLKNNIGKDISIKRLSLEIKVSYPTAQKYVAILEAEKKILVRNLGVIKLLSVKAEKGNVRL